MRGLLQSPLTDSNRRPPPYHALRNGCYGLPPVADRLIGAVFGYVPFATRRHRLRPLGSINAPSLLCALPKRIEATGPFSFWSRHSRRPSMMRPRSSASWIGVPELASSIAVATIVAASEATNGSAVATTAGTVQSAAPGFEVWTPTAPPRARCVLSSRRSVYP